MLIFTNFLRANPDVAPLSGRFRERARKYLECDVTWKVCAAMRLPFELMAAILLNLMLMIGLCVTVLLLLCVSHVVSASSMTAVAGRSQWFDSPQFEPELSEEEFAMMSLKNQVIRLLFFSIPFTVLLTLNEIGQPLGLIYSMFWGVIFIQILIYLLFLFPTAIPFILRRCGTDYTTLFKAVCNSKPRDLCLCRCRCPRPEEEPLPAIDPEPFIELNELPIETSHGPSRNHGNTDRCAPSMPLAQSGSLKGSDNETVDLEIALPDGLASHGTAGSRRYMEEARTMATHQGLADNVPMALEVDGESAIPDPSKVPQAARLIVEGSDIAVSAPPRDEVRFMCPLCLEYSSRKMRIQPCGHELCVQCLLDLDRADDGARYCPDSDCGRMVIRVD